MSKKKAQSSNVIAVNKKARHLYELSDNHEAGMVLTGSEVKSLRAGHVNFRDSYVDFRNGEAFLVGLHIAPYNNAGYSQHDPDQNRKLLLHRYEIYRLTLAVEQKGMTIVPTKIYLKAGRMKVDIAIGRGKKLHDQRETLQRRAEERDAARELVRY
ncbi:MAG: SsrA-binding protein SmpB [Pseudomonadota bacterium]